MDELLDPLRSQGRWDSHGHFTLDSQQALQKMGRFALPDPRRYVLNLVSWAVASGAGKIAVKIGSGRLELEHDGAGPTRDDLRDLFAGFGSGSLALQELAIGLAAAATLPGARLSVEGTLTRLTLSAGTLKVEPWEGRRSRLVVEEKTGWRWPRTSAESELLERYCRHGEADLEVNGRLVSEELPVPLLSRAIMLQGEPVLRLDRGGSDIWPCDGGFTAFVGQASVPLLETPVLMVVRGVIFEEAPLPGLVAFVSAPGLAKDLSQSQLVHNALFGQVRQRLEEMAEELLTLE